MTNLLFAPAAPRTAPVSPPIADVPGADDNAPKNIDPVFTSPDSDADQHATLNASDGRIAAALAVGIIALIVLLRPFANVPMNDDFTYARTAEALGRTGHVVYNAWGSPLLWPQMAYGALVVKVWGFSWTHLALTGVALAGVTAGLFYLLLRACRIAAPIAVLGVAALTLNPIYLSVAPSFMTDIPSLALLLAPLLLLVRSVKRNPSGALTLDAPRYLAASVLAIVAGSNRQISWVAFLGAQAALLALLPASERKKILLGVGVLLDGAIIANYWFALQPYTITVDVQEGVRQFIKYPQETVLHVGKFLNLMGLLALPLALLALPSLLKKEAPPAPNNGGAKGGFVLSGSPIIGGGGGLRASFLSFIISPLFLTFGFWLAIVAIPWRGRFPTVSYGVFCYAQYFTSRGVLVGGTPGYSRRPVTIPDFLVPVMLVGGAFALVVLSLLAVRWTREAWARRGAQSAALPVSHVAVCALMTATLIQIAASIPWYSQVFIFDRYLLLLLPGPLTLLGAAATQTLRDRQAAKGEPARLIKSGKGLPIGALAVAAFTATLGVLYAQEYFAYTHARAELYGFLTARGVRPQQINGGFEMDADAQVQARGYINHPFLTDPKGAYQPNRKAAHISLMPEYFPDVDPFYRLSTDSVVEPTEDIYPEPVRVARYHSWLPPFTRAMYVYRVKR